MARETKNPTPGFAVHPGEILRDELKSRNINTIIFIKTSGLSNSLVYYLLKGERNITVKVAQKIGTTLKMDPLVWLKRQQDYDIDLHKLTSKKGVPKPYIDQDSAAVKVLRGNASAADKILVQKSHALSDKVLSILSKRNMTKRDFAYKLDVSESQLSNMLGGTQNFTMRTIIKMEIALDAELIRICK